MDDLHGENSSLRRYGGSTNELATLAVWYCPSFLKEREHSSSKEPQFSKEMTDVSSPQTFYFQSNF
jgi:hypothetical protein